VESGDFLGFLDRLESRYEEACFIMGLANWNNYSHEGPADLDGARKAFAALFGDATARRRVEEARRALSADADPRWVRRLDLWSRVFVGGSIEADPEIAPQENALEKRLTAFQLTLDGQKVSRAQILLNLAELSSSAERRRSWNATAELHRAMLDDFRRLVILRNARARELGFDHFYRLSLALQGIDESWLLATLGQLEEVTRDGFRLFLQAAAAALKLDALRPWDLRRAVKLEASLPDHRFPKEAAFEVLAGFHKQIGFPVERLAIRQVVLDIPFGGLSLAIHIPTDSRFLVNPTRGHTFYTTAFHEYGHSLAAVYTQVEEPIFKGYEWIPGAHAPAYAEGVAEVQAEFVRSPLWLRRYSSATEGEIAAYQRSASRAAVLRLRNLLASFFFEYQMYRDPEQDLDRLERETLERILLVDRAGEPPHWAADTWYTTYPCYYQNYILAAMLASQVHQLLAARFGEARIEHPEVASWLIENLYAPGESLDWSERIQRATGRPLDAEAYLVKLSSS
jgi:hypothetical protein